MTPRSSSLISSCPLSSTAHHFFSFQLISHFTSTIYSILIISLLSLNSLLSQRLSSSFPIHSVMFSSSSAHSVHTPPLSHHPLPPVLLCQLSSQCLTKQGIRIGKMPQNMARRQRHHWEQSGIFYQMSLSPRQPSLSSRANRSPLWRPVTLTTHTHNLQMSRSFP